jgi:cell division protein FtsB
MWEKYLKLQEQIEAKLEELAELKAARDDLAQDIMTLIEDNEND